MGKLDANSLPVGHSKLQQLGHAWASCPRLRQRLLVSGASSMLSAVPFVHGPARDIDQAVAANMPVLMPVVNLFPERNLELPEYRAALTEMLLMLRTEVQKASLRGQNLGQAAAGLLRMSKQEANAVAAAHALGIRRLIARVRLSRRRGHMCRVLEVRELAGKVAFRPRSASSASKPMPTRTLPSCVPELGWCDVVVCLSMFKSIGCQLLLLCWGQRVLP